MLQIRLNKPPNEGGGAQPDTVTVACPDHLVLADLPVAKSLGSPIVSAPLKIVGRKSRRQLGERVHICTQCDMPIAVYGRLSPCEHAFCLDCARSDSLCFLCEERIQKIQTIKMMEGLLVCAFPRCFKTFVKKSDLESHIRGNHMDRNHQEAENDGNDSEALSARKPAASESTVQGPGRQLVSHGSSNLQGYDRGEAHRLQLQPLRNFIQPKSMPSLPGQSPSRFSDQQLDNNPPPGFDRPVVPSRYGDHQGGLRQDSSKPESGFPEYATMQVHQHANFAMPPPAIPPPQFGYNLVAEGGVQQFYGGGGGGGGGGGYETVRPEMNQEQGSMLGFPPGPSGPWSMSPTVDLQGRGGIFQGGGGGVPPSNMVMPPPAVNKGSESGIQGGNAMEYRGGGNGGIPSQQSHSQLPPPPPAPYLSHQGNFYSNEMNNNNDDDGQMFGGGWSNEKRDSYANSHD